MHGGETTSKRRCCLGLGCRYEFPQTEQKHNRMRDNLSRLQKAMHDPQMTKHVGVLSALHRHRQRCWTSYCRQRAQQGACASMLEVIWYTRYAQYQIVNMAGTDLLQLLFFPLLLVGSNQHHFHSTLPAAWLLLAHLVHTYSSSVPTANIFHSCCMSVQTRTCVGGTAVVAITCLLGQQMLFIGYLLSHVGLTARGCDATRAGRGEVQLQLPKSTSEPDVEAKTSKCSSRPTLCVCV